MQYNVFRERRSKTIFNRVILHCLQTILSKLSKMKDTANLTYMNTLQERMKCRLEIYLKFIHHWSAQNESC